MMLGKGSGRADSIPGGESRGRSSGPLLSWLGFLFLEQEVHLRTGEAAWYAEKQTALEPVEV